MSDAQKQQRRERNKRYQDRLIERLGAEVVNLRRAERRCKNELKKCSSNNAVVAAPPEHDYKIDGAENPTDLVTRIHDVVVRQAAESTDPKKKPPTSLGSIKQNVGTLQAIWRDVTGSPKSEAMPCQDFSWLRDEKAVMESVSKSNSLNTVTAKLTRIVGVMKWIRGYDDVLAVYRKLMTAEAGKRDDKTKENTLSENQSEKHVPWPEIQRVFKTIKDVDDRFWLGLNVLFATRRLDYRLLRFKRILPYVPNIKDVLPEEPDSNWLIHNGDEWQLVFDHFKTRKDFGRQVFTINSKDLVRAITTYIRQNKVKHDQYFISTKKGQPMSSHQFSGLMKKTLEKYFDTGLTQTGLRTSFSTWLHTQAMSEADFERETTKLGHSLATSRLYYRKLVPQQ